MVSTTAMSSVLTTTAKTAGPTDFGSTLFYQNTKIFSHFDNYFGINYRGVSNKIQFGNYSGSGVSNEHAYTVNTKALIGGTHDGTNVVSNLNGGATSSVVSGASGLIGGISPSDSTHQAVAPFHSPDSSTKSAVGIGFWTP